MTWQTLLLWIVAAIPILLTVLPVWNTTEWWVRIWEFPRLQIAALLAGVLVVEAIAFEFEFAGAFLILLTLACLIWQISCIFAYTPLARKQVRDTAGDPSDRSICVIVSNVLQSNRQAASLLEHIERADPDVVLTVETDQWWADALSELHDRYPHTVLHPLDNTYGMLLFSRFELADVTVQDRVSKDIPSISCRVQLRSGDWIDLFCVHPEPPRMNKDVDDRDAELLLVAREVARDRRRAIVCGDLNDVAWSHTTRLFQRVSGLLDPRIGRGLFATFHAGYWFARWPLDHVFHDDCFALKQLVRLGHVGSDHFPVLVRLVYDPSADRSGQRHRADPVDEAEAASKIAEGLKDQP